jgi:transposase-like protein
MQRKIISREIKNEVLAKAKSGEKVATLADQYGISDRTIYVWLKQDAGEEVVSWVKYHKLKRENEELKRIIGEITLDASWKKKG